MHQHLKPPGRIDRSTLFVGVLLSITTVSCTSIITVGPGPADNLTAEQLNARIAQSEKSIYYQCQDHTLAVYDGSLYRKQGARSFALLSAGMEYGAFRWGANGETNEFNPVTKIEVVRSRGLVDRFECQALSFYDMGQRFAVAGGIFRRPRLESSIMAEQDERMERLKPKKKPQAKKRGMANKQAGTEENRTSATNGQKSIQPSQEANGTGASNAAQKPGTGIKSGASATKSQNENPTPNAASEPKAGAPGMNNPEEGKDSDGQKKAEPSNTAEQGESKEKTGWLAWLRKKLGLK
ncbi:MAG: hypothetical protein NTX45_27860 [Proteobacteria bacterium]|nr:hypothetical protein [Pseudomonadota bacterium]